MPEEKDKLLRVSFATHSRLMTLKELEKHPNVDSAINYALNVYERSPSVRIFVGTTQIWSRSV